MLPQPIDKRVKLALDALKKIYPNVDIKARIIGDPITVSWEADPHFLGPSKAPCPVTIAITSGWHFPEGYARRTTRDLHRG